LQSGDELHLAAGAEVYGAIHAVGAKNLRITGRGILRQTHLPFGGAATETHPVELIDCEDAVIDGPVFIDGCTWNIVLRNCDRIQIRNVTIFSERPYSTDGINPCDSRDVLVENCFARCKDDCISIKGLQRDVPSEQLKPISNILIRDCLFWSDNNNGLVVGTETWASEIHDIRFQRCDFVRVSGTCGDWSAAFAVQSLADTYIHDIVFEDIDVEYCSGNPFSILYLDEVYGIPGQRRSEGGRIGNIIFRDIRFHQQPHRHSLVLGMDDLRRVENVHFESITFGEVPVAGASDLRLKTNGFSGQITW
jgi:polygalacturonase